MDIMGKRLEFCALRGARCDDTISIMDVNGDRPKLIWLAVRRALLALIAGVDAVFGVETKNVTFIISEVGNSNRN